LPKGVVVRLASIGDEVTREIMKEKFGGFGTVEFVDFKRGDHEGYVRYSSADFAKKAAESFKEELGGKVPTLVVLEGDVEKQYWERVSAERKTHAKSKSKKGGRPGKFGKKRKRF